MVDTGRISHALMFTGNEGSGNLALALAFGNYVLARYSADFDAAMYKCNKYVHPDFYFAYPINKTKKVTGTHIVSKDFISEWREALLSNPYLSNADWLAHLAIDNKQGIINVNQAKEIIKDLTLKPYESEYKAVLIWLPEKMNNETANKLLKILEEPPNKTLFLLVSQNPEQLLPTIQSRVQMVHVKPLLSKDIAQALIDNYDVDPPRAQMISKVAQGNYLEAQRLINENEVQAFNQQMFIKWMRFLWQKEFFELMQWAESLSKMGRERMMQFFRYGLHIFRECLMINYGAQSIQMSGGDELAFLQKFAPYVNASNTLEMVQLFEDAEQHISRNANPRILVMDVSLKMMKLIRKKTK